MASNKYGYMAKIGVDTSEMKNADGEIRSLDSELKAVDRTIRQTGLTSEMAAQKQALLAAEVEATTSKLEELRNAQANIESGVQSGNISAEQFRAYQREVANTESALRRLNYAQQELEAQMNNTDESVDEAAEAMDNAGESSLTLGDIIKGNLISGALAVLGDYLRESISALKDFAMEGIELASSLTEVQNVVDVTFGADSAIYDWADTVSEKFGLAKLSAEQYAGTMGAMLKSSGINDGLEEMSMRIAELAGDMASFYNLDSDTAFEKIRSGISGETEPLKQLGINMSVVNLEAFAMSQGIDKSWKSMSQAEQTLLRYNYLMEQTADAQGDFSRTSDSLANQQRILELNLQNVKTELGEQLLPIMQNFLAALNENMPEIQEAVGNLASELAPKLSELADKVTEFMTDEGIPALIDALEWLVDNGDTVVKIAGAFAAAWAVDKISGFTGSLAQIPEAAKNSLKSLSDIATKLNTSVGTAFSNLGHHASNAMTSVRNAVTGAETASIASFAAITAAAAAAVASIVKLADELDTIAEGMNNITAENQKSTDNIVSLGDTWSKISDMSGMEKYNQLNAFYDDILTKQEEWNSRYKTTIDELNILQEKKFKTADETARMKELQSQRDSLDAEYATLEAYRVNTLNMLDKYDDETVRRMEEAAAEQQRIQANANKTNAEVIDEFWRNRRETTAAEMEKYDEQLATHKIDDNEYWSQRKAYLESHRDEESKEWWKWYDEVNAHYEKASEEEKKAAEKAASEAQKTFEDSIKKRWENAGRTQKENGFDSKWLEEEYKKIVDSLEVGTDIYYEYYDKLTEAQRELGEEEAEQWEKNAEQTADTIDKAYEKLGDELERAQGDYLKKGKALGENVTDKDGNDRFVLNDLEAETKALEKYQADMEKLKETGISDDLLAGIMQFDFKDGSRQQFIDEFLGMSDSQRKKYYEDYDKYIRETKEAAEYDLQGKIEDADKLAADGVRSIYGSMPDEAYRYGVQTADSFLQGIIDNVGSVEALSGVFDANSIKKAAQGADTASASVSAAGKTGKADGNYYSGDTVIQFMIDSSTLVSKTIDELADRSRRGMNPLNV